MIPHSNQKLLEDLQKSEVTIRDNVLMNTTVKDTVEKTLNSIENDKIKLKVNKLWVDKKRDNNDIKAQMDVRNKSQTWADDLRADVSLIDKETNKEVDREEKIKIASIPKLTPRSTYLVKGNEYQFTKQSRLRPGVYTRIQNNGEISSFFNVDKTVDFDRGFNNNFKINFNPEKKTFIMSYGNKNVPLINTLKTVGVKDEELKEYWGKDVYNANVDTYGNKQELNEKKLYESIFGKIPPKEMSSEDIKKEIKERLFKTELDEETTKITLGKPYKKVDKDPLLNASKKILDIHRGKANPDDRDSLIFKSFYGPEDFIRDKVIKNVNKIKNNAAFKLEKTKQINKSISSQSFDPFISGTITTSQLSNPPGQTNIMSMLGENSKYTVMGEGGVGSANAVSNEARHISNTQLGFIDPLHTPEGHNIGTSVHSTMGAFKLDNDMYSTFYDKSGNVKILKPMEAYHKHIAFPDEFDLSGSAPAPKKNKIKVVYKGEIKEVPKSKVDFIVGGASTMFDTSANNIPFLDSLQGNRGLTASKMQEQAVTLKNRDKPLFSILNEKSKNIRKEILKKSILPTSPVNGDVVNISEDSITIKDKDDKNHKIQLYNNFPLNSESFLHNTPLVKRGDRVKKGDILADNNNSKDGDLALGANLRVAYMPYKGYNYEDSAIMSESAAKKLTSEHLYGFKTKRSSDGVFSKSKFKAYYPEEINRKQYDKLDKDGVVKPGTEVEEGDTLVAHLEKRIPTADDLALGRLDKQLKKDMSNNAIKWTKGHKGKVTSVEKHGNSAVVNVKTEEPMKIADKISGLHGNKHIISRIVPDEEMPLTMDGKRIDLTMNPIGVTNRINTSQILEAAAGKIAEKTGKQYPIKNFDFGDNSRKIMSDLKKNGLTDKEILIDPDTNRPYKNPVMTGNSHILKLEHKIDHKFSARYRDGHDSNEQPVSGGETGGKNLGRMEMGALLARGANENLKEMFNIKSQRNDEYWKALEMGNTLPPPKPSFAWNKQIAMMKGAGIDVSQEGKTFTLKPMTDGQIKELSAGEIKKPWQTYRKKDLAPMKEGLYDPFKTGGMQGENYTHFKLPEPVLNPISASAVATLADMPLSKLEDVIHGKKFVDKAGNLTDPGAEGAISGSKGVKRLLKGIDVNKTLDDLKKKSNEITNKTELNKVNKKIKYLKSLKRNNMTTDDYFINNVLVVPPKFRPMFAMGTDKTIIMSDVNDLYQQAAMTADSLNEYKSAIKKVSEGNEELENIQLADVRGSLYDDIKAVAGLREPTSYLHKIRNKKGFVSQIDGGKEKQTKEGFFQDKVLQRRQDLVGRSTLILNPELGGDQLGIPKKMATKIFHPFIMKELVNLGYTPLEAKDQIDKETPIFDKARQIVTDKRLVIANRAPTLHRWNMTSFRPKLVDHKSIEVPGTVISKNFGGDFDGDSNLSNFHISIEINKLHAFLKKEEKAVVFGDFTIDSSNDINYITSILKHMEVNIPIINKLLITDENEKVLISHISQFPRIQDSKKVNEENGNEEYDVPEGVSIFTLDNKTHDFAKVPVTKFSVHKNLLNYTVKTSSGNSLLVSNDQSLVAINNNTFEIEKITPEGVSAGRLMPKVKNIDIKPSIFEVPLKDFSSKTRKANAARCKDKAPLDRSFGWLIGAMVGDGWVSMGGNRKDLCIASSSDSIGKEFERVINSLLSQDKKATIIEAPHYFDGHASFSKKHTIVSVSLTENFVQWIGKGAANKHLPTFYMAAPEEFRFGLLSGLLDTDGTVGWLKKKNGRQFNIQHSTISEVLADQVVSLCRSLGISASITMGNKTNNGLERRVVISTNTIHNKPLSLLHDEKKKLLEEFYSEPLKDSSVSARQDIVPFNAELFMIAKEFVHFQKDKDVYRNINDSKRNSWRITRQSAKRLIQLDVDNKLSSRWKEIVNNENITWVYAKSVELNNERVDMYDITAPGPYTFMLDNGIVVQDTFQIHTPISNKAIEEAEKMLPSSDMLKTGYDTVLNKPELDMVVGTYLVSKGKGGEKINKKYDNIDQARKDFERHEITYGDNVNIKGKSATFGLHEINSVLPKEDRKYNVVLDKNETENWIKEVTKKHNGKIGLQLADKMKDVGNNYVTQYGFTLGVSDTLSFDKLRDEELKKAEKLSNPDDPISIIKNYSNAKDNIEKKLKNVLGEDTMVGIGIKSGGSKGIGQVGQILSSPVLVADAEDNPIPVPITKSYSEGLNTSNYWATAHGARGGNIKKSIQSYKPGWLTKDLINSIYTTRIYGEDPVDNEGLEMSIDDKKNVINRYTAKEVNGKDGKNILKRNSLIDSDAINKMVKNKVKNVFVQSPLTDPTPGDGISNWSYGINYHNKRYDKGDNIGVISAHTLTEPSLNLSMKAFHTGGALSKSENAFDALDRTLRFNDNMPNKATLSSKNGVVKKIKKSSIGGYDVTVADDKDEDTLYVDTSNKLKVKEGQKVKKGQDISTGNISMHDVLKYKGMPETQKFLVDEIDRINENKLDRRDIETLVRGVTNTTRIMNPGLDDNYIKGDVAPLTTINYINKHRDEERNVEESVGGKLNKDYSQYKKGTKIDNKVKDDLYNRGIKRVEIEKPEIKHEPFLVSQGIGAKAATDEDWIGRLAHNRVKQVLQESTNQGWVSDASGAIHPIPKLVTGN